MTSQFIARQRVKYYWKAVRTTARLNLLTHPENSTQSKPETFWEYEQTPRNT